MKKIICFLLGVAMLCSMMTISIFADSEVTAPIEDSELEIALELIELDDEQLATASYVPFSSGVYRFDSMYNTQMCMMVEEGAYTSGAHVVQWLYDGISRDNLFKVEYAGMGVIPATNTNADYYVIRSMVNSEIGLTAAIGSNTVTLESLGTSNLNLSWTQYWVHMEDSGCDMWMNAATGTYLATPFDDTLGEDLEMSSGATAWWQLETYTGSTMRGIVPVVCPTSIARGQSYQYDFATYSSVIGENSLSLSYSVLDIDNTTTFEASISSTGVLTTHAPGTIKIIVAISGTNQSWEYPVTIEGAGGRDMEFIPEGLCEYINCQGYAFATYNWPEWDGTYWNTVYSRFLTANDILYGDAVPGASGLGGLKVCLENGYLEENFEDHWEEVFSTEGGNDIVIENNQWLVAFRVGRNDTRMDIHFWYRTSSGEWTNKHGDEVVQPLGNDIPTNNNSIGWQVEGTTFYTSDIIYYVITEE